MIYYLDDKTMIGQESKWYNHKEFCVWGSMDGVLRHTLKGHSTDIQDLALCGNTAVSAAEDLRLWDVDDGVCLRIFDYPPTGCRSEGFLKCQLDAERVVGYYRRPELAGPPVFQMTIMDLKAGSCTCTIPLCLLSGYFVTQTFNDSA